jgi:hypothetical protein
MTQPRLVDRHTVYLSNSIWKKLKERAILEESNATSIVVYLLEEFLKSSVDSLPLSRYQSRISEEMLEQRKRRTIYVSDHTWAKIIVFCEERKYSVSGVIEYVLMRYLGLLSNELEIQKTAPNNTTKLGRIEFDMGNDPFTISLTSKKEENSDQ